MTASVETAARQDEQSCVRRDQLSALCGQMRVGLPGNLFGIATYAAVLQPIANPRRLLVWLIAIAGSLGLYAIAIGTIRRLLASPEELGLKGSRPTRWLAATTLLTGTLWALGPMLLTAEGIASGRWPFVYVFAASVSSASAVALAASSQLCALQVIPLLALTAVFAAYRETDSLRFLLPVGAVVLLATLLFYNSQANRLFVTASREKFRNGRLAEQLAYDANHDVLTGLYNRLALYRQAAEAAAHAASHGGGYGVLFVDLDGFKHINDVRGHTFGDAVLGAVANRLTGQVRAEDALARIGGDEFVVLLRGVPALIDAAMLAHRVADAFDEPIEVAGEPVVLAASVGLAWSSDGNDDPQELLARADWAMYQAKEANNSRVVIFDEELRRRFDDDAGLELALRTALTNFELETWAQPLVELPGGSVCGVELLVRWQRPGYGIVSPNMFIPVAERSGLIVEIGRYMLSQGAQLAERWHDDPLLCDLRINVNVGARHLHADALRRDVEAVVRRYPLAAGRLVVELTETQFAANMGRAAEILTAIQKLGLRVAIDDFGTGYSSLAYLRSLPADMIKIDREFVTGLPHDLPAAAIVRAVVGLCAVFDRTVVAEGIENDEQMRALVGLGVRYGQGYFYGEPAPVAEFEARLLATLSPN